MRLYTFILCLIVFLTLTVLFSVMLAYIIRLCIAVIRGGRNDKKILKAYKKHGYKKKKVSVIEKVLACLVGIVIFSAFGYALYLQAHEYRVKSVPVYRVVYSNSMSKKHEKNTYLLEHDLHDQFIKFDLIKTCALPKESELKLYDIVVYELDDVLIVHRIVKIEEPNEKHPTSRIFITQGDNVKTPDAEPVKYSQMRAVYRGERIPYVGSLILFLQSPAGYLCIFLFLAGLIGIPLLEKKIEKEEKKRLACLLKEKSKAKQAQEQKDKSVAVASISPIVVYPVCIPIDEKEQSSVPFCPFFGEQ